MSKILIDEATVKLVLGALGTCEVVMPGTRFKSKYFDETKVKDAITALKARAEQPAQQEPAAHSVIAGALFDFMGWLTSRKERLVLSSADDASAAVEAITAFAKMRNLSLDDAKVQNWHTTPQPAQRKPLTLQELEAAWNAQADKFNQWDELGLDEIVAWAQAANNIKENT